MMVLPELPPDLQDNFESKRAAAELAFAKRSERFPRHPQLADGTLQLPILVHAIFFEFCFSAQRAQRRGDWNRAQTRRAIDAAFQAICDFYLTRERGPLDPEVIAVYRNATWRTAADDPRWKEILSEMATSDETAYTIPANSADLPQLDHEPTARIAQVLEAARSYIAGPFVTDANRIRVMLRYFDAVVWEYLVTTSAETFEKLIGTICERATSTLSCDRASAVERTQYWITNAREREANGIVGKRILVRIDPRKAVVFRELAIRFRGLLGSGPDLQVVFEGGGRSFICGGTDEAEVRGRLKSQFDQISGDAMAALGFRFSDASWSVFYWLDILRQESLPPIQSRLVQLYKSSAEFCDELETRAQKAQAAVPPSPDDDGPVSTKPSIGAYLGDWTELEICFLSDERVQITIGERTESRNYAEFGFEDRRSKTPNLAWLALRFLAELDGAILQAPDGHGWTAIERRMQEIRKRFRTHFRLEEDPIVFKNGYQAQFRINCGPSYKS